MRLALALVALAACAPDALDAPDALPADALAPPMELTVSAAIAGQPLVIQVDGAAPGDAVRFFYSLGGVAPVPGTGPTLPGMGSLRGNLNPTPAAFPGGSAVADARGHAEYRFTLPAGARSGMSVGVEAAVRAVGGRAAYQTDGHTVVIGARACAEDGWEPNDYASLAPTPGDGTLSGLRVCPGDRDVYAVWADAGDWITGTAWFTHAQGDVNVEILGTDGVTVLASSHSATQDWEQVHATAQVSGVYYVAVALAGEGDATPGNDYVLATSAVAPPPVLSSGTARVRGTWSFDLDGGRETEAWRRVQNDFWWEQMTSTTRALVPEGGAMFGVWGTSQPGWGDCAWASRSSASIDGSGAGWSSLAVGTWVCGYTADNHVTRFQVVGAAADNTMTLAWTTWDDPAGYSLVAEGQVTVPGTWSLDLDAGAVSAWTGSDDLWWQQMTSTTRQLVPRNGATFAALGFDVAGPVACEDAALSSAPINGDDLAAGPLSPFRSVCAITSLGQRAAFSVVSVDPSQNNGLVLGYAIWQ